MSWQYPSPDDLDAHLLAIDRHFVGQVAALWRANEHSVFRERSGDCGGVHSIANLLFPSFRENEPPLAIAAPLAPAEPIGDRINCCAGAAPDRPAERFKPSVAMLFDDLSNLGDRLRLFVRPRPAARADPFGKCESRGAPRLVLRPRSNSKP